MICIFSPLISIADSFFRGLFGSSSSLDSHEAKEKLSGNAVISHAKLASTNSVENPNNGKIVLTLISFLGSL